MDALEGIRQEARELGDEKAALDARRSQIREELRELEERKESLWKETHAADARVSFIAKRSSALERAEAVLIEHQPEPAVEVDPVPVVPEPAAPVAPREPTDAQRELDEARKARRAVEQATQPKAPPHATGREVERVDKGRASAPRHSVAVDAPGRTWKPGQNTTAEACEMVVMLLEDNDGQLSQKSLVDQLIEMTGAKHGTASGWVSGALLYLRSEGKVRWTGDHQDASKIWALVTAEVAS